ncbi:MAG: aspartate carbamoyltransferase catalytic subunit [Clostridia bacterium]|nr:MAG: aspartate carbamoyltransferase catalytic subunit [Clostridia bacterium]
MAGLAARHLLGLAEMEAEEINLVLETARPMAGVMERPIKKVPTLRGKVLVTLFYEPSTRTRVSFELAAKYMGADTVSIAPATSSVVKGENLRDTVQTLEALGADMVVVRHQTAGVPGQLAGWLSRTVVVNAGDGMHEHPTQGLLDLFTIREEKGRLVGLEVAIIGDILHSRVARSDIWGLTKMGARVRVAGPATLLPPGLEKMGAQVYHRLEPALEGADVVIALRLQQERQRQGLLPSLREYAASFGLTPGRLALAKPDVLLMHPGPVNRGVELAAELVDAPCSAINRQVTNGVAVRMAVLYLLLGGG